MFLDDLEGTMKRFHGGNDVCAISSSDATPLGDGGEATVAGVIGAIISTADGVVAPCETVARNGGMPLLSNEETDSL